MDPGRCFADVIGDPQALNDFLNSSQVLSNQQIGTVSQPSNGVDFLTSIVQAATGEFPDPPKAQSINSYSPSPKSLPNYETAQNDSVKYSQIQPVSSALNTQLNTLANTQTYNYMTTVNQMPLKNSSMNNLTTVNSPSVQNSSVVSTRGVDLSSLSPSSSPKIQQHGISNQNSSSVSSLILNANMPVLDVNSTPNRVYTPKAQNRQAPKHMPNILSKGATSAANTAASHAILLPANMGGKYIIVNNPGQGPQSVTVPQNAATGTQQQVTPDMLQNAAQQNQQLLVLPANYQQLVTPVNTVQPKSKAIVNQPINSLQQKALTQPLISSKQNSKQSTVRPKSNQPKSRLQGSILPKQHSPAPSTSSPSVQYQQQWQPVVQKNTPQGPVSNSLYQMQNMQGIKGSENVKIIRPSVQPRDILPKPATQQLSINNHNVESKADIKASTAKLSHYPTTQNQLQNLQNLVSQQSISGSLATAMISSQQQSSNAVHEMQNIQNSLNNSNLNSQTQQKTNALSNSNFATVTTDSSNVALQTASSVALQQLLQLSQAAAQGNRNQLISNSMEATSLTQTLPLSTAQQIGNQNKNRLTMKEQLIQQALAGSTTVQKFLQSQRAQSGGDKNLNETRASLIEKNAQNIINRQNAIQQSALQEKNSKNHQDSKTNVSSISASTYQDGQNQPLQLFMPKQLNTAQLLELQQKLLAGKLMQKVQGTQQTLTTSIAGTVSISNHSGTVSSNASPASRQSLKSGNVPAGSQTFTLKQVPASGTSGSTYQFVASTEASNGNQILMPVSTQGMQVFLKTSTGISQLAGTSSSKSQNVIMVTGTKSPQKLNLPLIQGNNALKSGGNASLPQGIRIQNAATSNIVIKQLETTGHGNVLSEQQKAIQNKKMQQLLLQLTPTQKNLLLKKQKELANKGLSIPLTKLILQVKQEQATPKIITKEVKAIKRPATEDIKAEEANESKVARRLKHCLSADQTRTLEPSCSSPFHSVEDALSRLLPYHIYQEPIPPEIEWHKAEAVFSIVSKQLIARKEKLIEKYHSLLLEESKHVIPSSEMVMLERIFLADEKAKLAKDREDAKLGVFRLFPEKASSEETSAEQSNADQKNDSSAEGVDDENVDIELDYDDKDSINEDTNDDASYKRTSMEEDVELSAVIEEQERDSEEDVEEIGDEDMEEQIEDEDSDDCVELEEDDIPENNSLFPQEGEVNDDEEEQEADSDAEDEEVDDEEAEDDSIDMNQVLNRQSNIDFVELVDFDDFDRTNEQNMSEELSEATFHLMADLENDMQRDYYD